jgi:hypothetical protein
MIVCEEKFTRFFASDSFICNISQRELYKIVVKIRHFTQYVLECKPKFCVSKSFSYYCLDWEVFSFLCSECFMLPFSRFYLISLNVMNFCYQQSLVLDYEILHSSVFTTILLKYCICEVSKYLHTHIQTCTHPFNNKFPLTCCMLSKG